MSDFQEASRIKLRFNSERGLLTTEQLWDLPLVGQSFCLDYIAQAVHAEIKFRGKKSFVTKKSKKDSDLELQLSILKQIIKYKLDEQEAIESAAKNKAEFDKLAFIINEKENDELKSKSLDELKAMANKLKTS